MALATLTRPVFLYFPVIVSGFLVYYFWIRARSRRGTLAVIFSLCVYFVLTGVWCYRNYRLFGVFEISPIGSYNLLYYSAAGIESRRLGISIDEAKDSLEANYFKDEKNFDSLNIMKRMEIAREYALRHIRKFPVVFVRNFISDVFCTFLPQGSSIKQITGWHEKTGLRDVFEMAGPGEVMKQLREIDFAFFGVLAAVMYLLLFGYFFALSGVVISLSRRRYFVMFFLCSMIGYFILVPAITGFGDARFRVPAVPFICMFAAYGLVDLICERGRKAVEER